MTNPAYSWAEECQLRFGTHPVQAVHDWNAAVHADEGEGEPERRAFTRPELEAFFDYADEQVVRVRGKGRKGWLPAFRDAALFKTAYGYSLRRNESRMLDEVDVGPNPHGREFGDHGTLMVRHGKAKKGSPPKRRSVLTVWQWTPVVIEEWVTEVRPGMRHAHGPALWPSERGPQIGLQRLDSRFAAYRDALGLDPALEFHSLRRFFITDAIMNGLPPHIAQIVAGHSDINSTMGYKAVYPSEAIEAHRAFMVRRRATRPGEEYRVPTDEEWDAFLGHFEKRKLSIGTCGRAFATPCIHEHACIRCSMLRPDPAERPRLVEIRDNLRDRIAEAEREGWLGEIEGLQVSLAGADDKLAQIDRRPTATTVDLGLPNIRSKE
ncbi:tyrosine-type recombinase/integrase [Kitasatospora sp. NPDC094019]|uniref:tyrosine-type recombinase/integrase n=1 Tax=Kitasatospora sp. NPDC094019 TaxID=3364091 RepID=UPI0037FC5BA3